MQLFVNGISIIDPNDILTRLYKSHERWCNSYSHMCFFPLSFKERGQVNKELTIKYGNQRINALRDCINHIESCRFPDKHHYHVDAYQEAIKAVEMLIKACS